MSGIEMESSSPDQSTRNVPETQNRDATVGDLGGDKSQNLDSGVTDSKKRKALESRSGYWVHYDKFDCPKEKIQKARCNYCKTEIKADPRKHGTNGIMNHYKTCKQAPREVPSEQMRISMQKSLLGDFDSKEGRTSLWKFDDAKIRKALCYMIIVDELPFKHVENLGFNHFLSVLCPQFNIPSRKTIAKQIFQIYLEEKLKLKSFLKKSSQRVCITTDTWTSIQKINYMSLTVHFIDNEWKLQKRILNFCPITSHKGEEIWKAIEKCIREWGIENIFTITVDNASSNDVAVSYLKKKMDKLIYYGVLLDPRNKLEFLEYSFDRICDVEKSEKMKGEVREGILVMFNDYKRRYEDTSNSVIISSSSSSSAVTHSNVESGITQAQTLFDEFKKFKSAGVVTEKSELDRYLTEEVEVVDINSFNLLGWCKVNVHRFPVLSRLARDILVVPVSTVASEAAFSTGRCVLNAFRSSLLPKTVQALICTQDWLRGPISSINIEESINDSDTLEREFSNLTIGPTTSTNGHL